MASATEALRRSIDRARDDLRVAIPARVTAYRAAPAPVCSAQPLVRRVIGSTLGEDDPVLDEVPVIFPGTRRFALDFALRDGDTVLLVFGDRDLTDWSLRLGTPAALAPQPATPTDPRTHELSDAVAIPLAITGLAAALPAGPTPGVAGAYRVSLLGLLDELLAALQIATVPTVFGPQRLDPITQTLLLNYRARLAAVR